MSAVKMKAHHPLMRSGEWIEDWCVPILIVIFLGSLILLAVTSIIHYHDQATTKSQNTTAQSHLNAASTGTSVPEVLAAHSQSTHTWSTLSASGTCFAIAAPTKGPRQYGSVSRSSGRCPATLSAAGGLSIAYTWTTQNWS